MYTKSIQNNKPNNKNLDHSKNIDDCQVSIASTEIMLDRFCIGEEIEFPFSK